MPIDNEPSNSNEAIISDSIERLKLLMQSWKKMPNSRITSEEHLGDAKKQENKYRVIYFQKIFAELDLLAEFLPNSDKIILTKRISESAEKVRGFAQMDNIPEYLIDEADEFAIETINRYFSNKLGA